MINSDLRKIFTEASDAIFDRKIRVEVIYKGNYNNKRRTYTSLTSQGGQRATRYNSGRQIHPKESGRSRS